MYSDEEKRVFGSFPDGKGEMVYADPLRVYRHLVHWCDGDLNLVLRNAHYEGERPTPEEEPLVFQATEKLIQAALRSFDLVPFDKTTGTGYTDDDLLRLLNGFLDWLDDSKKKDVTSQPSSPPLDPEFSGQLASAM